MVVVKVVLVVAVEMIIILHTRTIHLIFIVIVYLRRPVLSADSLKADLMTLFLWEDEEFLLFVLICRKSHELGLSVNRLSDRF